MRIKLYLDEDVPLSLSEALKNRGVDLLTTQESKNTGNTDREQIEFAVIRRRAFLTHNKVDFIRLHSSLIEKNHPHYGIIVSDQLPIGVLLKRIMNCWFTVEAEEMKNRLVFLSNWK